MTSLYVDERWQGQHGIGRYATEVLKRLDLPWVPLGLRGSPSSPLDTLRRIPGGSRDSLVYSPGYNALPAARREVVTIHDLIHLTAGGLAGQKYRAYYAAVIRPVVRRTGVVITVSETSATAVREWIADEAVEVVNCGIGVSSQFTAPGDRDPRTAPYVMYVGNLRAHKNVDVVLRALTRLPEISLRMLLPRGEHGEAERRVHELGLQSRVTLLAGLDDAALAAEYRGAFATVMPSLLEGFGLPPLESIMSGTPVIFWHGCSAVLETVGDRGTSVSSSSDPDEWAAAIRRELEQQRRVTAPRGAYDWDSTASQVSAVLSSRLR